MATTAPRREPLDAGDRLRAAADRLEALRDRTPGGEWETAGLLASRPEVIARYDDGTTEHVADTRARTASWISGLSPRVVEPLITWLRVSADAADEARLPPETTAAALTFAAAVIEHVELRG
ncbi:hypothetical protein LQ327_17680 [Actinomycetospora endophytica]|uniref:MftR C-terminal domain-containing protein n=1 Tax=Actinomycetospora endophytica TaxID=2291215 RepID=A0ABS8PA98_9PSEU|nr:hypothetical protein [Actinomycetospora endophytica]MCD2195201.1 hypothetical protein [Actinomycetospora endophytica]